MFAILAFVLLETTTTTATVQATKIGPERATVAVHTTQEVPKTQTAPPKTSSETKSRSTEVPTPGSAALTPPSSSSPAKPNEPATATEPQNATIAVHTTQGAAATETAQKTPATNSGSPAGPLPSSSALTPPSASTAAKVNASDAKTSHASLEFEVGKVVKANVKGLTETAIIGLVIFVILVAVGAPLISLRLMPPKRGTRPPVITRPVLGVGGFALVIAVVVFLFLQWRLAPLKEAVGDAVQNTQRSLGTLTEVRDNQARTIARLQSELARAREDLTAVPALQSTLMQERERLRAREAEINKSTRDAVFIQQELAQARNIAEQRREDVLRLQYNRSLIFGLSMIVVAAIAGLILWFIRSRGYRRPWAQRQEEMEWRERTERAHMELRERMNRAHMELGERMNRSEQLHTILVKNGDREVHLVGVEWKPEVIERMLTKLAKLAGNASQ